MNFRLLVTVLSLLLGMGQLCYGMNKRSYAQMLEEIEMEISQEKGTDQNQNFDDGLEISEDLQEEIGISKKQRTNESVLIGNTGISDQDAELSDNITLPIAALKATAALKLFKCSYCEEKFFKSKELVNHANDVHPDEKKIFGCSDCDKSFKDDSGLRRHKNSVHKGIKYTCNYHYCGKSFSRQADLKQHEDSAHKGIRYTCDYPNCGQSFSKQSNLKRHKDSAHKEIKYSCPDCGKSFTTRNNLKQHEDNIHNGIKHICFICSKSFNDKSNLKFHEDSVHKKIRHTCNYPDCNKSFASKQSLTKHIAKNHFVTTSAQTPELTSIATPLIPLLSARTPDLAVGNQDKNNQDVQSQEKEQSEHSADVQEVDNIIQFNENNE